MTPRFNKIQQLIKLKSALNSKLWQVSIVADIIKLKKNVIIIAGTSIGKSLFYQSILLITGGIVLVILSTIALIED